MKSFKAILAKPFAKRVVKSIQKWASKPVETQEKVFQNLITEASNTVFGKDHDFISINTCLLYTSPSPRDQRGSRMPSSA